MRADQPKIKKELRDLKAAISLLQRQLEHREEVIKYLYDQRQDRLQDLLTYKIEYERLLLGKPALTKRFFAIRVLTEEIKALDKITYHDPFIA